MKRRNNPIAKKAGCLNVAGFFIPVISLNQELICPRQAEKSTYWHLLLPKILCLHA